MSKSISKAAPLLESVGITFSLSGGEYVIVDHTSDNLLFDPVSEHDEEGIETLRLKLMKIYRERNKTVNRVSHPDELMLRLLGGSYD